MDDQTPELIDLPTETNPPAGGEPTLSESVAESVAAAQAALEDSMNKAAALQMTAMQTAIQEFKASTDEVKEVLNLMTSTMEQIEDLKAEALELVEALKNEAQDDQSGGGNIQPSIVEKPPHIKILKNILSK